MKSEKDIFSMNLWRIVPHKYSVCTTSFRSVSLVDDFVRPFIKMGEDTQILIIDNDSNDGTIERLANFGENVKGINLKCTRGLGRQKAMDLSDGEIIINVEFDVEYTGINVALEYYDAADKSKIYYFIANGQKCNASLYIGKRELFGRIGGFPDLNYAEDLYMNKIAKKMGLIEYVNIDMPIKCLEVAGMSSGAEARYEKSKFKQFSRRVIATRDILFVNRIGYGQLMEKYKLKGIRAILIGFPEYILGRALQFTIKAPKLEK